MPAVAQHITAVSAMRVTQYSRAPMPRRHVSNGYLPMAVAVPPVQLDNIAEAEVGDKIKDVLGNHDRRGRSSIFFGVLHQRTQRGPVQMIEMRVCDQDKINGGKITNFHPGLAESFQDEQPAREVGIDDNIFAANLNEEAGVPNERHAHLAIRNQHWFVRFAYPGSDRGMPHQTPEI